MLRAVIATALLSFAMGGAAAPQAAPAPAAEPTPAAPKSAFDPDLAKRTGADARGMRNYILVLLKTGPKRVPDGAARDAMFAAHMANINRLANEGKLIMAGPFVQDDSGWRGLYVFNAESIDEARPWVESDPVIKEGEMVAEYHRWYASAGLMTMPGIHRRVQPPQVPKAK